LGPLVEVEEEGTETFLEATDNKKAKEGSVGGAGDGAAVAGVEVEEDAVGVKSKRHQRWKIWMLSSMPIMQRWTRAKPWELLYHIVCLRE